ncbi:MAG: hypothetical protein J0M35_21210 [Candidatus Obscuribacter phosphatis]|uniref:Uncharacterized protein n=1 Tax=Candidatus Obscuribacter phosphatis TaxID=1906157 RepID=A0A8J7PAI8_9BACT|nr:hypothetical protein [Candidatus Obscuribacter phosphatis]
MKSNPYKRKTVAKKASKESGGLARTGQYVSSDNGSGKASGKTTVTYKPGSLLARSGGMVPTVELAKRAAQNIS